MEKQYKPVPDCEALKYKGTPEKPDIKIFVSHRIDLDSETIDNPLYIPVRCGAVYDKREGITMLGDDTGDNISGRRYSYGELTTQYWSWKNVKADYYGFCNYNEYLSFENKDFPESSYSTVTEEALHSQRAQKKYGLNELNVQSLLKKYDVIIAKRASLEQLKNEPAFNEVKKVSDILDLYEHTLATPKPSQLLKTIIKEDYPFLEKYFRAYMDSENILLFNSFIMKENIFRDFCMLEFEIIEKLEEKLKEIHYGEIRVTAYKDIHLIILAVYLDYVAKEKKVEIHSVQSISFISVHPCVDYLPAFKKNNIAIMTMSSDEYAPYLGIYLKSVCLTATAENNYDILVFERNISQRNKKLLLSICDGIENISLRFYNMNAKMSGINFFVSEAHFAVEAYYRLLLPWTLPYYDKIVAMDCDIVVKRDLATLYHENIDDFDMAAVIDNTYRAMLNGVFFADDELKYARNTLKLKNPYEYVNTGVLVLNLAQIRKKYSEEEIISFSEKQKFKFQEQDTMNVLFQGNIKFLDSRWNDTVSSNPNVIRANEYFLSESTKIEKNEIPYALHYYAHPKPWFFPDSIFAEEWWSVARTTPFYEQLIAGMINYRVGNVHYSVYDLQNRMGLFDTRTPARKFVDKLCPPGTLRRKFVSWLAPKDSLRRKFCKEIYYIFKPQNRPQQ